MNNFLQLSVKLLIWDTRTPFKRYEQLRIAFYVSENFSYPKVSFLLFIFFLTHSKNDDVNDVCMPSLCFHERIFTS